MATVIGDGKIKLDNGQVITPNTGGWYDGQQYWGGTLSAPGVINSLSDQQGAGQAVNPEVIKQSNIDQGLAPGTNEAYLGIQTDNYNLANNISGTNSGSGTNSSSPLSDLEKQITDLNSSINTKKAEADKRRAEVNENPFLSEASRVGRIAKIDSALNDTLKTDIDNLTVLTNSLEAKQKELAPDYEYIKEIDDNGNLTIITLDKKTGKIVNTTSGGKVGKATKTGGSSYTETKDAEIKQYKNEIQAAAINYVTLEDLLKTYIPLGVDPNDIYAIYNASSSWGPARTTPGVEGETVWTPEKLKQYGITLSTTSKPPITYTNADGSTVTIPQ